MASGSTLSSSLEDYLETIYLIVREQGVARCKDIASRQGVKGSSVTEALKMLSANDLVNYQPYGTITLTPAGEILATEVLYRHETLRDFLTGVLAVDPEAADSAACRIEHVISADIIERIMGYTRYVKECKQCPQSCSICSFEHYLEELKEQQAESGL